MKNPASLEDAWEELRVDLVLRRAALLLRITNAENQNERKLYAYVGELHSIEQILKRISEIETQRSDT